MVYLCPCFAVQVQYACNGTEEMRTLESKLVLISDTVVILRRNGVGPHGRRTGECVGSLVTISLMDDFQTSPALVLPPSVSTVCHIWSTNGLPSHPQRPLPRGTGRP
jgi:hypothetical protein